jgi:galactokinase
VSALDIATARAAQALLALPHSTAALIETISMVIETCLGWTIPTAHLLTAEAGHPTRFTLVDTATAEWLPLEAPAPTQVGWGLVDVGGQRLAGASIHTDRKQQAEKALVLLHKRGFDQIASFRDLEHRDLHRALKAMPRRFKPVVRHLVTENRRVQRLVFATRHKDWQMFGALLLMSHASLRDDWKRTDNEVDFVVEQVEAMTLDGMYGARVAGPGGCVLVVGQPYVVAPCLDRIKADFMERFGRAPATLLL